MRNLFLNSRITLQHQIVTGAVVAAVLAGVGVAAFDFPWHADGPARQPRVVAPAVPSATVAQRRAAAGQAAEAAVVATVVEATPPSAAAAQPAPKAGAAKVAKRHVAANVKANAANARRAERAAHVAIAGSMRKTQDAQQKVVAMAPVVATKPLSIDDRYNEAVKHECPRGTAGLLCRETVRWRLCDGRWNSGRPGATRCHVEELGGAFAPTVPKG